MSEQNYKDVSCFGKNLSYETMEEGIYDSCKFTSCNVSEGSIKNLIFVDCLFDSCNLSMLNVSNASLKGVIFRDCKLLGVQFSQLAPLLLEMEFENCMLNMASFFRLKLKGTKFINCQLQEVDFAEADLTKANFSQSDLYKTVFENTLLENADFRTSVNFSIDPDSNYLKGAKFSRDNLDGLLHKHRLEIE